MTIIHRYTDDQAVDDGVLVALGKRDRVTRTAFTWLRVHAPDSPPHGWPIALLRWMGGLGTAHEADLKAAALAEGLIGTSRKQALKTWEENLGGGIWKIRALLDSRGKLAGLGPAETEAPGEVLWLVPNEEDGLTLMFPEDY